MASLRTAAAEPLPPDRQGRKKTVIMEWLHACAGCEMAVLNSGEELFLLLEAMDILHMPLLMDNKYGTEDASLAHTLPEADIGILSGGIAHEEHLATAQELRKKCTTLIALGTCAGFGGIPALLNNWSLQDETAAICTNRDEESLESMDLNPHQPDLFSLPPLPGYLDRVYAVDERISVDIYLPGCPPHSPTLVRSLLDLRTSPAENTTGQDECMKKKSVCEHCPTIKKGMGSTVQLRRSTDAAGQSSPKSRKKAASTEVGEMRCLLEQGFLCMGPVTATGCNGTSTPLCISAKMPCRGCHGPVDKATNPLLAMMNILASNGIKYQSVTDRRSLLRFAGAHNRLRYKKK